MPCIYVLLWLVKCLDYVDIKVLSEWFDHFKLWACYVSVVILQHWVQ